MLGYVTQEATCTRPWGGKLKKSRLTDYVGELSETKKEQLDKALQIALALSTTKP